jgi:hypothetical protein
MICSRCTDSDTVIWLKAEASAANSFGPSSAMRGSQSPAVIRAVARRRCPSGRTTSWVRTKSPNPSTSKASARASRSKSSPERRRTDFVGSLATIATRTAPTTRPPTSMGA